jgi:hypothetical protein
VALRPCPQSAIEVRRTHAEISTPRFKRNTRDEA